MPESNKKKKSSPSALAAIAAVERAIEETQRNALKLLAERRVVDGGTLNDWLTAEPEDCWPVTEWVERETEYELRIALPGFDPSTTELTGKPRELIIETRERTADTPRPADTGGAEPTICRRRLRRHVDIPVDFRADNVKATLLNGVLTIIAPKASAVTRDDPARKWRINIQH